MKNLKDKKILCLWREKLTYKLMGGRLRYGIRGDYDGYETKHFLPALKEIFKKVDFLPLEYTNDSTLYNALQSRRYDYFLIQLYHDEITPETLVWARDELKTITIRFAGDDEHEWEINKPWGGKKVEKLFNWNITTYKPELYSTPVIKTMWGANEKLFRDKKLKKDIDISFCGVANQDRPDRIYWLNTKLVSQMKKIETFGAGWSHIISNNEYVDIFNRSKININFSRNEGTLQIKGRDFEVPMCGGFLITEYNPELEKYFRFGKEIETYKSNKELLDKIVFYSNNDKEREKIARAGYRRAQSDHCYKQRFLEIFIKLEEQKNG